MFFKVVKLINKCKFLFKETKKILENNLTKTKSEVFNKTKI
jgi:hypothetical protein